MKEYSLAEAYHKSLIDLICKLERIMIAVNGFPLRRILSRGYATA